MATAKKNKIQLTTTIKDQEHFLTYFSDTNKKLLIIDVHPAWSGSCTALEPCYKNLQTSVIDEFEKRIDIVLVDQEKLEDLKNPAFESTTKPKIILALEGKIVHEIYGPNISELEENVKKFVPYI